jgi:hypothetical protein
MRSMRSVHRVILVLLVTALVGAHLHAQDGAEPARQMRIVRGAASVTTAIDRLEGSVADRFTLWIDAGAPADTPLAWPEFGNTFGGMTVISKRQRAPLLDEDGRLIRRMAITMEPYLPGSYALPGLTFTYDDPETGEVSLTTDPITIEVVSLLDEDEQVNADVGADSGPVGELSDVMRPEPVTPWYVWALAVGGGGALVTALVIVALRRHRRPPPLAPSIIARDRLATLAARYDDDSIETATIIDEIAEYARWYVAARFGLATEDHTTEEILAAARGGDTMHADDVVLLDRVLRRCDAVRFSPAGPSRIDAEEVWTALRDLVDRTIGTWDEPSGGQA